MVEAGNFIETATPFLLEKGIAGDAISEFKSEVFNLIKAARKEDVDQMNASMDKVMALYRSFMAQYKKS